MISLLRRLLGAEAGEHALGPRGERAAATWLKRRGYRIIDRNVSFGDDEADIIALDPDATTIVIVEVKTRTSAQPPPEASVGRTKQFRIARCAARLQKSPRYRDKPMRFDVVAVVWPDGEQPQFKHWPGAFQSPF